MSDVKQPSRLQAACDCCRLCFETRTMLTDKWQFSLDCTPNLFSCERVRCLDTSCASVCYELCTGFGLII